MVTALMEKSHFRTIYSNRERSEQLFDFFRQKGMDAFR